MKITWIGTPNYWEGRQGKRIDRIVIHWMVGTLASTDTVFSQNNSQVSAHYGIEEASIHQYVKESNTAWHSGDGNMNLRSIGIEHSATPSRPASTKTIETSAQLVADICKRYSIPCDRSHIIKHSEVSPTQCPGTIPVDTIISKAANILKGGDVSEVDRDIARILAFSVGGRNGYDGRPNSLSGKDDAELKKNHVGKETNSDIRSWYNSAEGKKWREITLPQIIRDRDNYKKSLDAANKQIMLLDEQLKSMPQDTSEAEKKLRAIKDALGIK